MIIPILLALFCLSINIPLGRWRSKYKKFSAGWFVLIHASVPVIIALRIILNVNNAFIPLFIVCAVAGQLVGRKTSKTTLPAS